MRRDLAAGLAGLGLALTAIAADVPTPQPYDSESALLPVAPSPPDASSSFVTGVRPARPVLAAPALTTRAAVASP
jgi:hypothetical protein